MNQNLTTPGQQFAQLHALLRTQVESYNRHYHKGNNTSVPVELARELMESIRYTLAIGVGEDMESALRQGQAVLQARLEQTRQFYRLVSGTAPEIDSDFYREALEQLGRYLEIYDPIHFAARTPDMPDYPLLRDPSPLPPGIEGAQVLLQCFWYENQILAALEDAPVQGLLLGIVPDFWGVPINLCEQPLINAMGRGLLGLVPLELTMDDEMRTTLLTMLQPLPKEVVAQKLRLAMDAVCGALALPDKNAEDYARTTADHLLPRMEAALIGGNLEYVFV